MNHPSVSAVAVKWAQPVEVVLDPGRVRQLPVAHPENVDLIDVLEPAGAIDSPRWVPEHPECPAIFSSSPVRRRDTGVSARSKRCFSL